MVSVSEADEIILKATRSFGVEEVSLEDAPGRVLAENLLADRDLPPYNRVMMDGIAINYNSYENGLRNFSIKSVQAAGDRPVDIADPDECIEIMTGAVLPKTTDTVIRYEDMMLEKGMAFIQSENIVRGQSVHYQGADCKKGSQVVNADQLITSAIISMAASIGAGRLKVKKLPRVIILSSGDELVDVDDQPEPFQIRRSNNYAVKACLKSLGIIAELRHIPDDETVIARTLEDAISNFDVMVISGGVSMGKFDYIPGALSKLGVEKLVYKVKQKPGQPFWFGKHENGTTVFAFPGNPVSTFLCLHRYLIPWLRNCLGLPSSVELFAALEEEVRFNPSLQYFLPVKLISGVDGKMIAKTCRNNGSGDFASLVEANAFLELPAEKNIFLPGDVYKAWPFL